MSTVDLATPPAASPVAEPETTDFLSILGSLRSPVDGKPLIFDAATATLYGEGRAQSFPVQVGIPCLFAPNHWPEGRPDVTDIVKEFY